MKKNESYRMQKQELILRFFAFYHDLDNYTGNLASYLNNFMASNRFMNNDEIESNKQIFKDTIDIYHRYIEKNKITQKISITVQDAICYGIAKNICEIKKKEINIISHGIDCILKSDEFSEKALSEGLAKKQRLIDRMKKAQQLMV
jgi:hypothetical protein